MLDSYLQGMAISFAFIFAIGAQNIFVLKQGLRGEHIFWVCLICALSDSILILLGVYGFASILQQSPKLILIAQYAGAVFLIFYAVQHLRAAIWPTALSTIAASSGSALWPVILSCMAITWLNPHVYLDTVVLIASVSTQFEQTRAYFALGAITASWLFFFSLGYAARLLVPILSSTGAWRIFDVSIAILLMCIAYGLLQGSL